MPTAMIENPEGAYGQTAVTGVHYETYESAETATTINKGQVVSVTAAGKILLATTTVDVGLVIGVAMEAIEPGKAGMIATRGVVNDVAAEGVIAANAKVGRSGTTAGSVAADATPTTGEIIGIALSAAASNLVDLYVSKM